MYVDSGDILAIVAEEDAEMHRRPPLEPELGALTLWPESEKVFGHGYEVCALSSIASRFDCSHLELLLMT